MIEIDRTEPLLTIEKLIDRYLFGCDLTNDAGERIKDEVFNHAILAAIDFVETECDFNITPKQYIERRDYVREDYTNWAFFHLYHYPIIASDQTNFPMIVEAQYPINRTLITFPYDWYRIYPEFGEFRLVPTSGSITQFFMTAGGQLPYIYWSSVVPQFFKITYWAGFQDDAIPQFVNRLIGFKACNDILNLIGDLVAGAGVAGYSIGIDGLSQSLQTTASAENTAYGARIKYNEKELKEGIKAVRSYYHGMQMAVTG